MASKKRLSGVILISLFFVFISIPLVASFLQDDKEVSGTEKRNLATMPPLPQSFTSLLQYPERFERYFNDHFGLREFFLDIYAKGKIVIGDTLGVNIEDGVVSKNVIKGKQGWYFLNRIWDGDPVSDYRNIDLYSRTELSHAVLAIAAHKYWLESQGIRYLLFIAPNKHTIYSENLPDYITKQGDVSSMDQLKQALARYTSVAFVDLRPVLIRNKSKAAQYWQGDKKEARLYWKTDSHWNGAGADIAQYAVAQRIEKMLPGKIVPRHRAKADFIMMQGKGDLASLLNDKSLYAEKGPVVRQGTCSQFPPEELHQKHQVTTCPAGKINAIIFHDSFFTGLKYFFADYFTTTFFLWERMTQKALEKNIPVYRPAIVIEELAERFLPYVPDIRGESYTAFWGKVFAGSGTVLYTLDEKKAAAERRGHKNENATTDFDALNHTLQVQALTGDPYLYLPDISFQPDRMYVLKVEIRAPAETVFELFYSRR